METDLATIMTASVIFATVGAAYAIFGGLRAVAVSDTYSGVLVLGLALLVVYLSLQAIDFDLSGIPAERLTMIGDDEDTGAYSRENAERVGILLETKNVVNDSSRTVSEAANKGRAILGSLQY